MKTIKASKLREVLSSKGVNEGFIDRLLSRLKITTTDQKMKSVERKLDALQKDKSFQALAIKHGFEFPKGLNQFEHAVYHYNKTLDLKPDYFEAYSHLSALYYDKNLY